MTTRVVAPSGRMRSAIAAQRVRRFFGLAGSHLPQSPVMRGVPGDEPHPSIVKRSTSPTIYKPASMCLGILLKRRKKLSVVMAAISSPVTPIVSASTRAVLVTKDGSLRLPRNGTGAR